MATESKALNSYDLIVIGAGSGGLGCARRASMYGAKALVIERGPLGGTCVNVGCVPKKVMYNAASLGEALHDAKGYGFAVELKGFDWETLKQKRDAYVKRLNGIYENNLVKDKVDLVRGIAKFESAHSVSVSGVTYEAKHIVIASGSKPQVPDFPGKEHVLDSDGFFQLEHLPKKVAIVGAGYIAVEFAGIFNALGVPTSLLVRHDRALRSFDSVIRDNVHDEYVKSGVNVVTQAEVQRVDRESDGSLAITTQAGLTLPGYDVIIAATGRVAELSELDVAKAGVALNGQGFVDVDAYQNTNVEGVYALGDVCGHAMLTPVAIAAGRQLAARLFRQQPEAKLDYTFVPTVIFSHPPSGTIGYTEEQAKAKFGEANIKCYTSKFTNMYHAMTDRKTVTHYKIVCRQDDSERVVGLHLFGIASDEILQGFGVAIKMGATKADFDSCVAIHPTAAEEIVTMR